MESEASPKARWLPLVAAIAGNTIWGFSVLFSKMAFQVAEPNILLSIRFLLAALIMTLMLVSGKCKISLRGKKWKPLFLLAATELLYFYFESYGILYTNATFAGVVLSVVPVVAILLAILFLREFPTKRQAIFCILPVAGVVIMTISGNSMGIIQPIGVALLGCACLSSAVYKTANRKSAEDFNAFERTYIVILSCAVVFTLDALRTAEGDVSSILAPLAVPGFLFPVLMLSIFCSVGANLLVNYAAGNMSVVKISSFGSLTTLCSMFAGVIFLQEPLTVSLFIGALLILIGIRQVTKQ